MVINMNVPLIYIVVLWIVLRKGLSLEEKTKSKRILVTDPSFYSQQVADLTQRLSTMENTVTSLQSDTQNLRTENQNLKSELRTETQSLRAAVQSLQTSSGVMYVRWGRKGCSNNNGTELVYSGYTAGQKQRTGGGVATTICLPQDPTWGKQTALTSYVEIEGSEYEGNDFGPNTADEDIPCAVCRTLGKSSVIMIPARVSCYPGMTTEYHGYLAGGKYDDPSDYICIDENPEFVAGGQTNDDTGRRYFPAKVFCGPLPCPPYHYGNFVACSVCSR